MLKNLQAPDVLRALPGWLVWRFEPNGDKKPRKVPYYVNGARRHWTQGTAADRKNLADFDTAKRVALERGFEGVGLATLPDFGITALDFDDCVMDGKIMPEVEALIAGTYAEYSPSGKGIRAFVMGSLGAGKSLNTKRKPQPFGFEVFDQNGFVTVTGNLTELTQIIGGMNYLGPITPELQAFRDARLHRVTELAEYSGSGQPVLGLTEAQIHKALSALPDDLPYDDWLKVGMAIHHETEGEGFILFDEWSLNSPKGSTSDYNMERWASFGRNPDAPPFTMRSLIRFAENELQIDTGINLDVASEDDFEVIPEEPKEPRKPRFNLVEWEDLKARPRRISWIVKNFLPRSDLGVLFGASTAGKSFVAMDLACAIGAGKDWNGHRVTQGRVLYVVAEGRNGFLSRMDAYDEHHGLQKRGVVLIENIVPNLTDEKQITDLILDIKEVEPFSLIVMDTFAQMTAGINENSGEDMGNALAQCHRISRHTGAMVLLVHHSGKDASKGARGWSGLRAAADVELEVERCDDLRSIKVTKLKDGRDGAEHGFKLVDVVLGKDEDGDDITSCVVEYTDAGRPKQMDLGKNEALLLSVLQDISGFEGSERVSEDQLLEIALTQMPNTDRSTKGNLRKALGRLAAKNHVVRDGGFVTLAESAENDEL